MTSKKVLFEDGSKKIIETDSNDQLILSFTDTIISANGSKQKKIKGRGAINNAISCHLFDYLESYNILTYFISKSNEKEMTVKKVEMLPFEVLVSNVATAVLGKKLKIKEGQALEAPVIEYILKQANGAREIIDETNLLNQNVTTMEEKNTLSMLVLKINALLKSFLERRNIKLVDCLLQFGKYRGHFILGGELSPDTCRMWDSNSDEKMNKDRFLQDLGKTEEYYLEIHNRIFGGDQST